MSAATFWTDGLAMRPSHHALTCGYGSNREAWGVASRQSVTETWLRSARLRKSPARYLCLARRASYTSSTFFSFSRFSSTTFWSVVPPNIGLTRHWYRIGFSAAVYWLASTSSHTSTIADSLRLPFLSRSGLCLRATYMQIARDSGKNTIL